MSPGSTKDGSNAGLFSFIAPADGKLFVGLSNYLGGAPGLSYEITPVSDAVTEVPEPPALAIAGAAAAGLGFLRRRKRRF